MSLVLVTHESSWKHRNPPGHPERVDRLDAVINGVHSSGVVIRDVEALPVDEHLLASIHSERHVEGIQNLCLKGGGMIDEDTYAVKESLNAAIHAAGAGPTAVRELESGDASAAMVVVRPPGHHAERERAMGFCLFNNIAVTAALLRGEGHRVAIVDWDVHHGNGTQRSFYEDPELLYVSLHEFPFYPGTGWITETGSGKGIGTTFNVPLPGGTPATSYLAAFNRIVQPVVEQFSPDWILVSNGYDSHELDPLGGMRLESEHFGWMASSVSSMVPSGRTILMLEGGYSLDALEGAARETTRGLEGEFRGAVWPTEASGSAGRINDLVVETLQDFWSLA